MNLFWALDRVKRKAHDLKDTRTPPQIAKALLPDARAIHDEDRRMCHAIGSHGAALLENGQGVLTHCNAGGLATSEYGTALSLFFTAADQGKKLTFSWTKRARDFKAPASRLGSCCSTASMRRSSAT